jgi:hypothetical protein
MANFVKFHDAMTLSKTTLDIMTLSVPKNNGTFGMTPLRIQCSYAECGIVRLSTNYYR